MTRAFHFRLALPAFLRSCQLGNEERFASIDFALSANFVGSRLESIRSSAVATDCYN